MQALWAVNDEAMTEMTLPFLDEELAQWQYPFGSLARAGVRLAAGSDWPVSTPDPLAALHVAVNRVDADAPGAPFLPQEALGVRQAFAWSPRTSTVRSCTGLDRRKRRRRPTGEVESVVPHPGAYRFRRAVGRLGATRPP